jgi:hypothetical protein
VGDGWRSCGACGVAQPVKAVVGGEAAGVRTPAPSTDFWSRTFRSLRIDHGDPSVATALYAIGGAFLLAAIIYFLATSGFPPHTTTTFEYGPNGSVTESTSPDTLEILLSILLFAIGGILLRAGKAASSESRRQGTR